MIENTAQQQINLSLKQSGINSLSSVDFANKSENELMEAAKQFEAVFIGQMFKAMDATIQREEMFSGGRGEEMFRSMYLDEIAKNISSSPETSFGFAKQIYEQMKDLI